MNWSRREFISTSALGLLATGFPRLLTATPRTANPFTEVRRNVGIYTARGGTIGWLANDGGAVVVDSQYRDTAPDFVTGFRARGAASVDALINTHYHYDHTGGNAAFRDYAGRIVAHESVPERQRSAAEGGEAAAAQAYADTTFDGDWSTDIGDETVRARYYGRAHTDGDATVSFERANVVHMGDLVFHRAYPFADRDGGASIAGWVEVLEAVTADHDTDTIYIFGHARADLPLTGSRADVLVQRDFLSAVLDTTRRAIAAGRSREEAVAMQVPGFDDFGVLVEWLTPAQVMGAAWDELSAG